MWVHIYLLIALNLSQGCFCSGGPSRLIPRQDTHTSAEPAMPGGPSSVSVFWGLSTKSKAFSHLSGCREPLAVPVAGGGSAQGPQHQR